MLLVQSQARCSGGRKIEASGVLDVSQWKKNLGVYVRTPEHALFIDEEGSYVNQRHGTEKKPTTRNRKKTNFSDRAGVRGNASNSPTVPYHMNNGRDIVATSTKGRVSRKKATITKVPKAVWGSRESKRRITIANNRTDGCARLKNLAFVREKKKTWWTTHVWPSAWRCRCRNMENCMWERVCTWHDASSFALRSTCARGSYTLCWRPQVGRNWMEHNIRKATVVWVSNWNMCNYGEVTAWEQLMATTLGRLRWSLSSERWRSKRTMVESPWQWRCMKKPLCSRDSHTFCKNDENTTWTELQQDEDAHKEKTISVKRFPFVRWRPLTGNLLSENSMATRCSGEVWLWQYYVV